MATKNRKLPPPQKLSEPQDRGSESFLFPKLLKKQQLARYLGIGIDTLSDLIKSTNFPEPFWRSYYSKPQIDEWLTRSPAKNKNIARDEANSALKLIHPGRNKPWLNGQPK